MRDSENNPTDIPIPGEVWTCPMHSEVREQAPGSCPKCGMPLIPVPTQESPDA